MRIASRTARRCSSARARLAGWTNGLRPTLVAFNLAPIQPSAHSDCAGKALSSPRTATPFCRRRPASGGRARRLPARRPHDCGQLAAIYELAGAAAVSFTAGRTYSERSARRRFPQVPRRCRSRRPFLVARGCPLAGRTKLNDGLEKRSGAEDCRRPAAGTAVRHGPLAPNQNLQGVAGRQGRDWPRLLQVGGAPCGWRDDPRAEDETRRRGLLAENEDSPVPARVIRVSAGFITAATY